MAQREYVELLEVNCGGCGRPLKMLLEELLERRTVDCLDCEKKLLTREAAAQRFSIAAARVPTLRLTPSPSLAR